MAGREGVKVMGEEEARKITRFYLDVTKRGDDEIKKLLIDSGNAIRYFTLKSGEVIKKNWKITKLRTTSRLYNNAVTDNTFKKNESDIGSVDILILGK